LGGTTSPPLAAPPPVPALPPESTLPPVRTFQYIPEPDPPFWTQDWFKSLSFILVLAAVGGWAYYQFYWLIRLPQERDLTDLQGKITHVTLVGHDDVLLEYTLPGSETVRFLSLATLSPSDQVFIAKLNQTILAKVPFTCTLTDSGGKETTVHVLAHNDNWAQCIQVADGSTSYVSLSALIPSDQAVLRLLPASLDFRFPLNYTFTGAPNPHGKVQLLGRNDDMLEFLDLASGKKKFIQISDLAQIDQSLVREFSPYLDDAPPQTSANRQSSDKNSRAENLPVNESSANSHQSKIATNILSPNSPLPATMLKALVIIRGDYSEGSGFIAKLHDQYFVVTNEHLLSGNKWFTVTDMDGNDLPLTGPLYGATDYDLAILKIPDNLAKNYLEVMPNPQTNASVRDQVTIAGNSQGAGVPAQINGQLTDIGPEYVQVNAQLAPGLSGSPIIDRPSGKVIGVATMSMTYKTDSQAPGITTDIRWFGNRLDNINADNGWVKLDWARFRDEGLKIRAAMDLITSLDTLIRNKPITDIPSQLIQTAITDFQAELTSAVQHNNKQEIDSAFQAFNSKLRSLADSTTYGLSSANLYPYHAKILMEMDDLRKYLDLAFEDNNRKYTNIAGSLQSQVLPSRR